MDSPSARCPSATAYDGVLAFPFGVDNCHTRITVFLASGTEARYSRSRPAIAWFSPAPTLGQTPILFVDDGSPYRRESRPSPLQMRRRSFAVGHSAECNEPLCEVITRGRKGNP